MKRDRLSICIIAHNAYGVLANVDTGHAGGIEIQTPLLAKWLARNGYDVSMITWDEGIKDNGIFDGVKLYKLCRRDQGLPIIRFVYPRWTSFISALKQADADLYYYNCGDLGLGQLTSWAKYNGKKTVYSVASEADCYRDLSHLTSQRDRIMYKHGLKNVDAIITQTKKQQAVLKSEYGLDSVMVPMPCEGFGDSAQESGKGLGKTKSILWVGRITVEKRLELLLDVAESMTDVRFDIAGAENRASDYANDLVTRAKKMDNVILHGRVKHEGMKELYESATLLASTSIYEGFPNVYLEAWSKGLPIVSTFDPDDVIQNHELGCVAHDRDTLSNCILKLFKPENYRVKSMNAIKYYKDNHSIESSMPKMAKIFEDIIS